MESQNIGDWTMQEYYDVDRIDLPEVDGALLMELLDDTSADLPEDDRLDYVIRSLEAEIGSENCLVTTGDNESTTEPSDDGGLEDMLSDFDSYDEPRRIDNGVTDGPFDWPEVAAGVAELGHDMVGWYADAAEVYGEPREYYVNTPMYYYSGEVSMEQVYSPLWE